MNDKIIISAISKIYFIMTSFLLFIFLSLSIVFIVLQNGFYIENIAIPKVKIKQLYIKWNESLDVSIKEIEISNNKSSSQTTIKDISKILKKIPHFYSIFEKITISKIIFNDLSASFNYTKGEDSFLSLNSPHLSLKSSLSFESELLNINIHELNDKHRDIKVHGNIILNIAHYNASSSLFVNIHDDIFLNILSFANKDKAYYKINSPKDIKSISYAIELLNLDKELQYWVHDAINFSSLSINKLYGWVDFNDLTNAYKNIQVSATGEELTYAYNKYLDSIHTNKTDLIFENGILYIYPRQAYTYKSKLEDSWLKIDFTKREELLTLKLLFNGKLDKDTLKILKQYKIKIPFLQNSGQTKTDLTLKVNLRTIDVDAKGDFFTKKANFKYLGYDIDIFDAHIKLNNYDVTIKEMLTKYKKNISTNVDAVFSADTGKGIIDFSIKKIDFPKFNISLNTATKNLKAQYILTPQNDTIKIQNSQWKYFGYDVNIDKMNSAFKLKDLKLKIPRTLINSPKLAKAYVSGKIDLEKVLFDLDFNIKNIYLHNIDLMHQSTLVKLQYNKSLTLNSNQKINFLFDNKPSYINPISINLKDKHLSFKETYINIDDIFKTKLSAEYSFSAKSGYMQTRRTRIKTNNFGLLYFNKEKTRFDIKIDKQDKLSINSKDLKISFIKTKKMWKMDINSIFLLSLNSEFLKRYHIKDGNISFYKKNNDKNIIYSSKINYPYKLIVKENILYDKYLIHGLIDSETNIISMNINDSIFIDINDIIDIEINNIGININALVDIVNSLDAKSDTNNNNLQVSINAKDSHLYVSENRHVLSNNISLNYKNKILTAHLVYKKGLARLKYKNNHFDAYGENFNDFFMEKLFALSKFENGDFKFSMSGDTKEYDGIFTISNTTIIEYKVLNNILAFVNTIPSLITFSLPEYNKKGLKVKTAYMKFTSKEDYFNISDIYLDSTELDIAGKGSASFKYNKIDIDLNLKTDIGSKVSKIPLLGHLLMGKDSISATLNVSGALDNPNVTSLIAKDIVVAPLNILLRTLSLPYDLIKSVDSNFTSENE